jgi:hypothetical protein
MLTPILTLRAMKLLFPAAGILLALFAAGSNAQPAPGEKLLRHVVLFKFKEGTTPQQIKQVEDAFRALPAKIILIRAFEWGTNVSPENLAQGYTHCFLLTFSSDKDRDAYLVHPAHKEFGKLLGPYLDKATVVDFWSQH